MRPIVQDIQYFAESTGSGMVELRVERESITFREEIIPDGVMAGMKGHREIPSTESIVFELSPRQAEELRDQLSRALAGEQQ